MRQVFKGGIYIIRPKKMNAVILAVRDLQRSLTWYKEHFGFDKLYDVPNGVLIGANGVEVVLSQVDNPEGMSFWKAVGFKDYYITMEMEN